MNGPLFVELLILRIFDFVNRLNQPGRDVSYYEYWSVMSSKSEYIKTIILISYYVLYIHKMYENMHSYDAIRRQPALNH